MKRTVMTLLLLVVTMASSGLPQAKRLSISSPMGYAVPKQGFVPTPEVAILIAEAVLTPVYGKDVIVSERPFTATLKGGIWTVMGKVPCYDPPPGAECPGGAAEVRISKKTGQILYMIHTM